MAWRQLGVQVGWVVSFGLLVSSGGCGSSSDDDASRPASAGARSDAGAAAGTPSAGASPAGSGTGARAGASDGTGGRGATGGGGSGAASGSGSGGANQGGSGGANQGGSGAIAGEAGALPGDHGGEGGATGVSDGSIGVRFVGFIGDGPDDDLPAGGDFATLFPECAVETSTLLPPFLRFNECHARGIVRLMNAALAELVDDAPPFEFESLEIVVDPKLSDWNTEGSGSSYQLQHLEGNTYRRPNTMTFVMPSLYHGTAAGLAFLDQRLSPENGMLAIAVPLAGAAIFLHEFGHGIGFDHAGNAAGVGTYNYDGCGGITVAPPACLCEEGNYMSTNGSFAATTGCDACDAALHTTWNTPFYGPKLAAITECWLTRRLEPSDIIFVDADCFGIVESLDFATCKELEQGAVQCQCPSGQLFSATDCSDATQAERDAAASATCDRITCPPPPERPGVFCEGLVGGHGIQCTCEDPSQKFSLGTDCSPLTLAAIEQFCPPLP